jgi:hypothetical protein
LEVLYYCKNPQAVCICDVANRVQAKLYSDTSNITPAMTPSNQMKRTTINNLPRDIRMERPNNNKTDIPTTKQWGSNMKDNIRQARKDTP